MNMRSQFTVSVERLMTDDPRIVLLLGDIGVHGFRKVFEKHPDRAFNMGICEQAMVGAAAGMAKEGMVPIVHTIAPFLVERALEQIKVDFGYQKLPGIFVSVGASFDYVSMGCSHHAPADCELMKSIPGMRVCVPGGGGDLIMMLLDARLAQAPTYVRLSEGDNHVINDTGPAGDWIKTGRAATVVAIGPMRRAVLEAVDLDDTQCLDVSVVAYSMVAPFDGTLISKLASSDKILLVEPYYEGGLVREIMGAMAPRRPLIRCVGVPREFQRSYGTREEHDKACGLDAASIRKALEGLIDA